jgi:hypothetical protein
LPEVGYACPAAAAVDARGTAATAAYRRSGREADVTPSTVPPPAKSLLRKPLNVDKTRFHGVLTYLSGAS